MKPGDVSTRPHPCSEQVEQLHALHRGDLPLDRRIELDRHLETCSHCQAILAEYRAIDALIMSLPPVEPLPAMPAGLQELVGVFREARQAGPTHATLDTSVPPAAPERMRASTNLVYGRLREKLRLAVAVLVVTAMLDGFLVLFPPLHPRGSSQSPRIFASQHSTPLYLATSGPEGLAYAMNSTDSTIIWQQHTGHQLITSPLAADGDVYFPSDDGNISALRTSDGQPLWHARISSPAFPIMGLLASQDLITVGAESGDLVALRASSGSIAWHVQDPCTSGKMKRVSSEPYPCSLVPLVVVNGVVYGFADGLYAWNASTGRVIWHNPAYQAESLVISHGKVSVPYGYIVVLDASNGHVLHTLGQPGTYGFLAANDTTMYLQGEPAGVSKPTEKLLAFRLSNDTLLWQRTLSIPAALFTVSASSIYLGDDRGAGNLGHIAVGTDLYSWRASDGSQRWHWHDSGDDPIAAGLGVVSAFEVNGIVCLSTANGMYGWQASTGRLLWHAFQGQSMAGPVFQGQFIGSPPEA